MNGLRLWERDATLPARAGEVCLTPYSHRQVAALAHESLLAPDAPELERIEWTYARWKPGISLSSGYALHFIDGGQRALHLKRYLTDKAIHLAERPSGPVGPAWRDDRLLSGWLNPEEGLSISCFPHDRELPGLARALDLRRTVRLARERGLFGEYAMRAHRSSMDVLRYRPERRAVFRLDAGLTGPTGEHEQDVVAVRVLPPIEARRVAAARALCRRALPLPQLLMAQERTGILIEEWLDVDVPEPDDFGHAERAGSVLAVLHGAVPKPMEPPQTCSPSGLRPLFAWHPRLLALFDVVSFTQPTGAACWTHGDFHPDQVATDRESGMPRLLDLDRLGPGFAVDDLASWVADHVVEVSSIGVADAAAPLLRGYASAGGVRPSARDLAAAVGRALAQRAAAGLRRLERDAVAKAERLLQQSCELCRVGAAVP